VDYADLEDMKAGEWTVFSYMGFFGPTNYVIIIPKYQPPDELEGFPAVGSFAGLWSDRTQPNDAVTCPPFGCYDAELDGQAIPDRAYVFSGADAMFMPLDIPDDIEGYQKVDYADLEDMKAGEWTVFSYMGFFGPTNYVIIVLHDFVP